jgi:GST-like protein
MIDFYTARTPNGLKVAIALEEFGLPYRLIRVNLSAGEQKAPGYLALNPNGKIPTIVDRENHDFAVFESGAILVYLAELTNRFLPEGRRDRSVAMQWLMFQMAAVGPMRGQAGHFMQDAPEKISYAIDRYMKEAERVLGVLDRRLGEAQFLAGDEYTIADMATYPWIDYPRAPIPLEGLPNVRRWHAEVGARPAVQRGMKAI